MIKALSIACLALGLGAGLAAADGPAPAPAPDAVKSAPPTADPGQASEPGGDDALGDDDVYYAPIDDDAPDSQDLSPSAQALPQGSYLSRARIEAVDARSGEGVPGAELFLDGVFLGPSPLTLAGRVLDKPLTSLAARKDGYSDALRPAVAVPVEGLVKVALAPDTAARWYTQPAWVVGLGLLAASAAVYDSKAPGAGLALVAGGVGVISLSQLMARFVHLPALRRRAERWNAAAAPDPGPLDAP